MNENNAEEYADPATYVFTMVNPGLIIKYLRRRAKIGRVSGGIPEWRGTRRMLTKWKFRLDRIRIGIRVRT